MRNYFEDIVWIISSSIAVYATVCHPDYICNGQKFVSCVPDSCKQCGHGCLSCQDAHLCIRCTEGPTLVEGTCLCCPNDCSSCERSKEIKCLSCNKEFMLYNASCVRVKTEQITYGTKNNSKSGSKDFIESKRGMQDQILKHRVRKTKSADEEKVKSSRKTADTSHILKRALQHEMGLGPKKICESNYYGSSCNESCQSADSGCMSCLSDVNDTYGGCILCKSGFYNYKSFCIKCNTSCVDQICSPEDGTCVKGCVNGTFWGNKCEKACPQTCLKCDQRSGKCAVCFNGSYYGNYCDRDCSDDCKSNTCTMKGVCNFGCKEGKFGQYCDKNCPSNCFNQTCKWNTGKCSFGCTEGFSQEYCDRRCSGHCVNGSCFFDTRGCKLGCIAGYFGELCEDKCSDECNKACQRETGMCLNVTRNTDDSETDMVRYGAIGGAVLVVVVTIVFFACWYARRQRRDALDQEERRYANIEDVEENRIEQFGPTATLPGGSAIEETSFVVGEHQTSRSYENLSIVTKSRNSPCSRLEDKRIKLNSLYRLSGVPEDDFGRRGYRTRNQYENLLINRSKNEYRKLKKKTIFQRSKVKGQKIRSSCLPERH